MYLMDFQMMAKRNSYGLTNYRSVYHTIYTWFMKPHAGYPLWDEGIGRDVWNFHRPNLFKLPSP